MMSRGIWRLRCSFGSVCFSNIVCMELHCFNVKEDVCRTYWNLGIIMEVYAIYISWIVRDEF